MHRNVIRVNIIIILLFVFMASICSDARYLTINIQSVREVVVTGPNETINDVDTVKEPGEELMLKPQLQSAVDKINGIENSQQILLITSKSYESFQASLETYEKSNGLWVKVFDTFPAVLGLKGSSTDKMEGDKKSPAGIFKLSECFGIGTNPGTKMPYIQYDERDCWVDDPQSQYYNTHQKEPSNGRWRSAENFYTIGGIYKYFIVINYNEDGVKGRGSAIFLHIWRGENTGTVGCTAISEENLIRIIKWLDPQKNPVIIQRPEDKILDY